MNNLCSTQTSLSRSLLFEDREAEKKRPGAVWLWLMLVWRLNILPRLGFNGRRAPNNTPFLLSFRRKLRHCTSETSTAQLHFIQHHLISSSSPRLCYRRPLFYRRPSNLSIAQLIVSYTVRNTTSEMASAEASIALSNRSLRTIRTVGLLADMTSN